MEQLGELTYKSAWGSHAVPVDGVSIDDVREAIQLLPDGATDVHWNKNDNANCVVEPADLGLPGR